MSATPHPGTPTPPPGALRRWLDRLYDGAAALAALCLLGLLAMVLLSILGRQLQFHLPGTDAYAGYLMAACGFLALAHTLRRGEHIRVTLLRNALPAGPRRWLDRAAVGVGVLLSALLAFYSARHAWQSWQFRDISTAADATPLWIPQLGMALGSALLLVAFIDTLVALLRGGDLAPQRHE